MIDDSDIVNTALAGVLLLVAAAGTGTQNLTIFNETRCFSIPLGIVTIGLVLYGHCVFHGC